MAHCPASNAFLGSGSFPLRAHLDHGVRVAIGTDLRRDGEAVGDALRLGPYEAVVVERES